MGGYTTILALLPMVLCMATTTHCSWISGGAPPPVSAGDYMVIGDDVIHIPSPAMRVIDGDLDLEEAKAVTSGSRDGNSIANMPAAANSGKELNIQEKEIVNPDDEEMFIIQGKVYCDPCRVQIPTKLSYPLANTEISLVCHKADSGEETYRVEGSSDEKGKYTLNVVGDHAEEICEITVSDSPDPKCPELMDDENHVRVSLTNKHGVKGKGRYANPLGFMVTTADPKCKQALEELGFTGI